MSGNKDFEISILSLVCTPAVLLALVSNFSTLRADEDDDLKNNVESALEPVKEYQALFLAVSDLGKTASECAAITDNSTYQLCLEKVRFFETDWKLKRDSVASLIAKPKPAAKSDPKNDTSVSTDPEASPQPLPDLQSDSTHKPEPLDYNPTAESFKNLSVASNAYQSKIAPAAMREIQNEKDKERDLALQQQAAYFRNQTSTFPPMASNGTDDSVSSKSESSDGGASGLSFPDRGFGNPLESLRSKTTSSVPLQFPERVNANLDPLVTPSTKGEIPQLAKSNSVARSQESTSASPIVGNIQTLQGEKRTPALVSNSLVGKFPNQVLGNTNNVSTPIKGTAPKSAEASDLGNLGEVFGDGEDSRFDFSARSNEMVLGSTADSIAGSNESGGLTVTEKRTLKQVLPTGPKDENGRAWIFSYSPSKIIRGSCEVLEQSAIKVFCIGVRKRLAQVTP